MLANKLKVWTQKSSFFLRAAVWIFNALPFVNKIRLGKGNSFKRSLVLLKGTDVKIKGKANVISVLPGTRLINCSIRIFGNSNKVFIGGFCALKDVEIWIENDTNELVIGERTTFAGKTHISCIEGTKVDIGQDCMFSANITLRTGDSHSITDLSGKRINPSQSIQIKDHVWVGNSTIITKGVAVSENSVIGTGSVVTRKFLESNVVLAGNPASVIKRDISWDRRRLPIKECL